MSNSFAQPPSREGLPSPHEVNLPTIWSSCLAGGWLGGYLPGTERWDRMFLLLLSVSALFLAGKFMGESYRRPPGDLHPSLPSIPVDLPDRRGRGWIWPSLLGLGIGLAGCLGWKPLAFSVALGALVVFRARLCAHAPAGIALMGCGRFLLYPLANAASSEPTLALAMGEGVLLASYVVGLEILASAEHSSSRSMRRWPWLLIVLPIVINAALSARFGPGHLIVVALPVFWLARIALGREAPLGAGRAASLLAGTTLVDLSALVACAAFLPWLGWFAILFVLALLSERLVPTV